VILELPEIAGLRAGCPPRFLERIVEVEALHMLALLAGLQAPEQILHLVLPEAREREVEIRRRLEVGEETGEQSVVPGARDPVQRQSEEPRLFHGDVEPRDGDRGQPQPSGRDQALVTADDGLIFPPGKNRLDEAELAETPLEGVEFVLADAARVRGVRTKVVDRDLLDGEGGEGGGHRFTYLWEVEAGNGVKGGFIEVAPARASAGGR
jgi:hypothetical protein